MVINKLPEAYHIPLTDIIDKKEVRVSFNSDFLSGIGRCEDKAIFLLDFDKMVSKLDIDGINHARAP